ncbi:MAG: hypothetical protein EP298_11015 [Gammaproteobacteria bacterium]|nr:MAG: hypothetical protein EP298_11015 [Gammaproteobacteria bacterium]UTW43523.1 hypothetical protein KFE69_05375 [bacterium SCSIO 12844]
MNYKITPIFDSAKYVDTYDINHFELYKKNYYPQMNINDAFHGLLFLKKYIVKEGTYNSYRREIERLMHWSWLIAKKSINQLNANDIKKYIKFCSEPIPSWVGLSKVTKFLSIDDKRVPNHNWKPFVIVTSKLQKYYGLENTKKTELHSSSVKEIHLILSTFYRFLLEKKYVKSNFMIINRLNSTNRLSSKTVQPNKLKKLSKLQLQYILDTSKELADTNPIFHERTHFIVSLMHHTGIKLSEMKSLNDQYPKMNDFFQKKCGQWYFKILNKNNQYRTINISESMVSNLKRWRKYLGLKPLPESNENIPLFLKHRGSGPVSSDVHIRRVVQQCLDQSIAKLKNDGYELQSIELVNASPSILSVANS